MEIEDIKVDGVDMAVFSFLLALRDLSLYMFRLLCSLQICLSVVRHGLSSHFIIYLIYE